MAVLPVTNRHVRRSRHARRVLTCVGFGLVVACAGVTTANAQTDPAQELAERFAPVVRLVTQTEECGHGEPYEPTDVNALLSNPDVAMRGPWSGNDLIKIAPTGSDLATASSEYYLDLPGNPLKPGCDYEQWARKVTAGTTPTVYAHVATESGHSDRLALQYWLYYPFNDYNNKHESDWEMVQLEFAAADPADALGQEPIELAYSQHEGTELADWHDDKLEVIDGTHPVVYAAAGSHANYYESALYLGRSGQQGFGCDDTSGPTNDVRPAVKVIPGSAFPWVAYPGHWGQQESTFYNGPTGPITKDQWTAPITWQHDEGRRFSYAVPAGGLLGTTTTDFFCAGVAGGSNVVRVLADNPLPVLAVAGLLAVLLIYHLSRMTWRPSTPLRVARRRSWGQTITAAGRIYRSRLWLFITIGALTLPVAIVVTGLQRLIIGAPDIGGFEQGGEAGGWRVSLAALLTFVLTGYSIVLVFAATARALVEIDADRPVSVRSAYALALRHWTHLFAAFAVSSIVVGALSLSVLLVPVAVVLAVLFAFYVQAVAMEDRTGLSALRRSAALVRGRFWKIASLLVVSVAVAAAVGPLLGTVLLLTTDAAFAVVNVVAGITFAGLMPYIALTMTYAYFDARIRHRARQNRPPAPAVLPAEEEIQVF